MELDEKIKSSAQQKSSVDDISTQLEKCRSVWFFVVVLVYFWNRVELKMTDTQLSVVKKDLEKTKKKEKDGKAQIKKLQLQITELGSEVSIQSNCCMFNRSKVAALTATNQRLQKDIDAKTAENQQILSERTRALSTRAKEIMEINKYDSNCWVLC